MKAIPDSVWKLIRQPQRTNAVADAKEFEEIFAEDHGDRARAPSQYNYWRGRTGDFNWPGDELAFALHKDKAFGDLSHIRMVSR